MIGYQKIFSPEFVGIQLLSINNSLKKNRIVNEVINIYPSIYLYIIIFNMPPKKITKQQLSTFTATKQESKTQQQVDQGVEEDIVDGSNYKHNLQNLSSTRTVLAIVIGIFCGIINLNQLLAVILYVLVQLGACPLILISVGSQSGHFMKWTDTLGGITGSVLMFVCSWMISYNLVYTL